mgnify:CR=1 FL=1
MARSGSGRLRNYQSMAPAVASCAPTIRQRICCMRRCAVVLRFDVSQPVGLKPNEIQTVERDVNDQVRANANVLTRLMTPDEAIEQGAMALFGEKYGEEVRVVSMGNDHGRNFSTELCGGTHVRRTGDIGAFKIISEGAVAAGVRRIEAVTGQAALDYLAEQEGRLSAVAATLKVAPSDVPARRWQPVVAVVPQNRKRKKSTV